MTKLEKILSQLVDAGTISFNEREALKACVEVSYDELEAIPYQSVIEGIESLMSSENNDRETYCSFCHRPKSEVNVLINGKDKKSAICDYCVLLCKEIVEEEL